ncbi:MAG: ribonucleoside-diphosphate reductase subunit alpha [Candidatus Moraniibacteriota bacterium]|nr:MAG: ribonucleoside-diphosphate reductase subunit alpha [Candidatus Moranbacteria bacterium]
MQDFVEKELMASGLFDVAKAYIIYRYEHAKIREEKKKEIARKIEEHELSVTKRSGKREVFSIDKIRRTLGYHVLGIESDIDIDAILKQCRLEVYDGITTREVARVVTMITRSMIERDPAYSKLAARLLLDRLYRDVLGADITKETFAERHREVFKRNIMWGVREGVFDPRMLAFDLEALSGIFSLENDALFEYMGLEILSSRYLLEDPHTKMPLETPQMLWMRIAMGTALPEPKEIRDRVAKDFYWVLSSFLYTPGGRTLFQAGMIKAQLSNCFLNVVPDSLDLIFKTYSDNAQLLKWSGGTGTSWTPVRATGSFIKGTGVGSQGVVPFLKIANDVNVSINRSGKRRGAGCVYLETWHYDIEDFLELRKNTGDERRRTHDIDTASWIPDLFMKRVRDGKDWTLFSPDETPDLHELYGRDFEARYEEYERRADAGTIQLFRRVSAKDLWKKMLIMLFETGHPWITWKDPSNVRSPQDHVGVVHSSNLCTEITLNTSPDETAVCNLGSLNFAKLIRNGAFDRELVSKVTKIAVRMLDNVIDINYYPIPEAKRSNLKHRPLGLGIRGYHDALYLLGINFDSAEALDFADESMELVSYEAILASSELARERGAYQSFKGSKWARGIFPQDTIDLLEKERGESIPLPREGKLDWTPVREHVKRYGMRNSNILAIAPTASTANLVGCVPCVEPMYKNIYVKSNKEGDFVVVNTYLVNDLKKLGLWTRDMLNQLKFNDGSIQNIKGIPANMKEKYKEVFEISASWLVEAAARRGKWIDQSQSLNIFFRSVSGRELSEIYFRAWELGLKTTYYLRTLGASQVEKSTVSTAEYGSTHTRKSHEESVNASASSSQETPPAATEEAQRSVSGSLETSEPKLCRINDPDCESCQG